MLMPQKTLNIAGLQISLINNINDVSSTYSNAHSDYKMKVEKLAPGGFVLSNSPSSPNVSLCQDLQKSPNYPSKPSF